MTSFIGEVITGITQGNNNPVPDFDQIDLRVDRNGLEINRFLDVNALSSVDGRILKDRDPIGGANLQDPAVTLGTQGGFYHSASAIELEGSFQSPGQYYSDYADNPGARNTVLTKVPALPRPANPYFISENKINNTELNGPEGIGFDWFEKLWLLGGDGALGNVISDQVIIIDLYSSYRRRFITLETVDNQVASQGVSVTGLPTLPANHIPQTSLSATLTVDAVGPPTIGGDIIFDYDVRDVTLEVTGTRVVLVPYPPQRGVKENIKWKTNVLTAADRTQQRISTRRYPRQEIGYEVIMRTMRDQQDFENLLLVWQSRVFGVPHWWTPRQITIDASIGDQLVVVDNVDYADFREGGLVMLFKENSDNTLTTQVLEVSSISTNSPAGTGVTINFSSQLTADFAANENAVAYPVVPCTLNKRVGLNSARVNLNEWTLSFESTDNAVDHSDASVMPTLNTVSVLEAENFLNRDAYRRDFIGDNRVVDPGFGLRQIFTDQLSSAIAHPVNLLNLTGQEAWERKQFFYSLKGSQVAFWLPTYQNEITITANIGVSAGAIPIVNISYAAFLDGQRPKSGIRIELNDGTVLYHEILSATEDDAENETLSIDPVTAVGFDVGDIKKVSFMYLVTIAQDQVSYDHRWVDSFGDQLESLISLNTIGTVNNA